MIDIDLIVVHCSATPADMNIGAKEIGGWHTQKGWQDIGYHFVIRRDGSIEQGRDIGVPGAHVAGHNHNSLGICLVGGLDDEGSPLANFTGVQYESLMRLVGELLTSYPDAHVCGHRELDPRKACPCFDVRSLWSDEDGHF